MPRAKNRVERGYQVFNWMMETFPNTAHPAELKFVKSLRWPGHKQQGYGVTEVIGRRIICKINLARCTTWDAVIETVLHEGGHFDERWDARALRARDCEEHKDEWALAYGRRYRAFHDCGGDEESRSFPTR